MEMFISFFSGKVMLFYGISLIMKEKSNASALIGSRRIDLKALEADCNAERMASVLESRALKIQRKSSLAVAPSQRKFALRQHNHLLRRQHCSSLCSQSEDHEHVANMTNALGHDFVGLSARAWPPQYSPPHFASKVSYSASPQGFVAPYYLAKTRIS